MNYGLLARGYPWVPEAALESPHAMLPSVHLAYAAALRKPVAGHRRPLK